MKKDEARENRAEELLHYLKSEMKHLSIPYGLAVLYIFGPILKGRLRVDSDIAMLSEYKIIAKERLRLNEKSDRY